jgi:hypothetical protein
MSGPQCVSMVSPDGRDGSDQLVTDGSGISTVVFWDAGLVFPVTPARRWR